MVDHGLTIAPRWREILFVLRTGCRWRDLPAQLGCGSGYTAWRRLRAWQDAGVWDRLHRVVLEELSEAQVLDWSRGCIDAVSVRAKGGRADRAQPHRPRQGRQQVPPALPTPTGYHYAR